MCSVNQPVPSAGPVAAGIGEITRAIDQLAADSRAGGRGLSGEITPELAERIAAIWTMLAALDPALARLITGYEARDN